MADDIPREPRKRTLAVMKQKITKDLQDPKVAAALRRQVNVHQLVSLADCVDLALAEDIIACLLPVCLVSMLGTFLCFLKDSEGMEFSSLTLDDFSSLGVRSALVELAYRGTSPPVSPAFEEAISLISANFLLKVGTLATLF